ncbi:MAG: aldose epimerase family protein [Prevotella sp.]|nr:galactose mutarotase [Prevotellaceae bacterium]MDY3935953.1 aldose epimerase family protein [Prevotella sp.]
MTKTEETKRLSGLKQSDFQTTIDGKTTDLYTLRNAQGCEIDVTNYGGAVVSIMMPDRNGNFANIIQSFDNIDALIHSPEPYLSTLIGRYGNRIAKGRFRLNGKDYQVGINNGENSLHGSDSAFNKRVWDATQISERALVLKYVSPYGEGGFTGELNVWVAYTLTDDNELIIKYQATTNKKTILNLTHHGFFSLSGIANPTPDVHNLTCEINADFFLPINEHSIPTGEILKVANTPFDFRTPKLVGKDIDADNEQLRIGAGYDHCFVLNKREEGELSFAARINEPTTGRTMEVYTTEPGMQLYTHNWADGFQGQHGATFPRRSAICFECQHFPDSPNRHYFPSVVIEPEREYTQKTIYKFGVDKG